LRKTVESLSGIAGLQPARVSAVHDRVDGVETLAQQDFDFAFGVRGGIEGGFYDQADKGSVVVIRIKPSPPPLSPPRFKFKPCVTSPRLADGGFLPRR
jgi:hypothetical protein